MRHGKLAILLPALVGLCATQAHTLDIVPTFDSSITSDPNASLIEGSINNVLSLYDSTFTNPVDITIDFKEDNKISLGQSGFFTANLSYGDYRSSLLAASNNDGIILPNLPPVVNPVPGNTNDQVEAESAQLRALGYSGAPGGLGAPQDNINGTLYDDDIELNTTKMNLSRTGPQDSTKYDIYGVVEHEVDEVLGLSSALDGQLNPTPPDNPVPPGKLSNGAFVDSLDFYRYSAPGVHSFTNDPNAAAYFSVDGGATPLVYFNQQTGGDFHDWASSGESFDKGDQVQNAFGDPGVDINLGPNEITALKAIGYNTQNAVPEPSSFALLALGLLPAGSLAPPVSAAKLPDAGSPPSQNGPASAAKLGGWAVVLRRHSRRAGGR